MSAAGKHRQAPASTGKHRQAPRRCDALADPAGHHDWVIEAEVDTEASDELGALVLLSTAMRQL